ncbi:MAG: hypothetical protein ACYC1Y_03405 [Minisyncoccota bacterium]
MKLKNICEGLALTFGVCGVVAWIIYIGMALNIPQVFYMTLATALLVFQLYFLIEYGKKAKN